MLACTAFSFCGYKQNRRIFEVLIPVLKIYIDFPLVKKRSLVYHYRGNENGVSMAGPFDIERRMKNE